jgi:hypothetical protein
MFEDRLFGRSQPTAQKHVAQATLTNRGWKASGSGTKGIVPSYGFTMGPGPSGVRRRPPSPDYPEEMSPEPRPLERERRLERFVLHYSVYDD